MSEFRTKLQDLIALLGIKTNLQKMVLAQEQTVVEDLDDFEEWPDFAEGARYLKLWRQKVTVEAIFEVMEPFIEERLSEQDVDMFLQFYNSELGKALLQKAHAIQECQEKAVAGFFVRVNKEMNKEMGWDYDNGT